MTKETLQCRATDAPNMNGEFRNTFYFCPNITTALTNVNMKGCFNVTSMYVGTQLNANLGGWNLNDVSNMSNFAALVTTWSQENYEATWEGWLRVG